MVIDNSIVVDSTVVVGIVIGIVVVADIEAETEADTVVVVVDTADVEVVDVVAQALHIALVGTVLRTAEPAMISVVYIVISG